MRVNETRHLWRHTGCFVLLHHRAFPGNFLWLGDRGRRLSNTLPLNTAHEAARTSWKGMMVHCNYGLQVGVHCRLANAHGITLV